MNAVGAEAMELDDGVGLVMALDVIALDGNGVGW